MAYSKVVREWFLLNYPNDESWWLLADQPFCPWCRRTNFASIAALKKHVKYCSFAPRPRGQQRAKAERQGDIEDLFQIKKENQNE